jgi:Cu/Ag efflux protein CusF
MIPHDRQSPMVMQVFLSTVILLAIAFVPVACGRKQEANTAPVQKYHLHGVIQQLDPKAHSATIKHQKIEGFMDAMTMEFPVKDQAEFAKLRTGETIDATVFVQDDSFWIGETRESK